MSKFDDVLDAMEKALGNEDLDEVRSLAEKGVSLAKYSVNIERLADATISSYEDYPNHPDLARSIIENGVKKLKNPSCLLSLARFAKEESAGRGLNDPVLAREIFDKAVALSKEYHHFEEAARSALEYFDNMDLAKEILKKAVLAVDDGSELGYLVEFAVNPKEYGNGLEDPDFAMELAEDVLGRINSIDECSSFAFTLRDSQNIADEPWGQEVFRQALTSALGLADDLDSVRDFIFKMGSYLTADEPWDQDIYKQALTKAMDLAEGFDDHISILNCAADSELAKGTDILARCFELAEQKAETGAHYLELAEHYDSLENQEKSEELRAKAGEAGGGYADLLALGSSFVESGDQEKATAAFASAIEKAETTGDVIQITYQLEVPGNTDLLLAALVRGVELMTDSPAIQEILYIGAQYLSAGDRDKCIEMYQKAEDAAKTPEELVRVGSSIYQDLEDSTWAEKISQKAAAEAKTLEDFKGIAEFCIDMTMYDEAADIFRKAAQLAADQPGEILGLTERLVSGYGYDETLFRDSALAKELREPLRDVLVPVTFKVLMVVEDDQGNSDYNRLEEEEFTSIVDPNCIQDRYEDNESFCKLVSSILHDPEMLDDAFDRLWGYTQYMEYTSFRLYQISYGETVMEVDDDNRSIESVWSESNLRIRSDSRAGGYYLDPVAAY